MTPYDKMIRAFGLGQDAVAAALQVPVATVLRWEAGTAEPSAAQWRDLAVVCGTSVPELLDGCEADAPSTILTADQVQGTADTFWGHLELWLIGAAEPVAYPVTARTAEQVRRRLDVECAGTTAWLVVSTLDNQVLVIPTDVIKSVALREHDLSQAPDLFAGEIYRALADRFDAAPDVVDASTSPRLRRQLDALVQTWELQDAVRRDNLFRQATVHFRDGSVMHEAIDHPACCWSIADADAMNANWVVLGDEQRERYVLRDTVRLIAVPKCRYDAQVLEVVHATG